MGMLSEFKEFAVTGNLLELASAVIIGGAVGKIITSMVDDIIMPVIGSIISADFTKMAIIINGATVKYGIFIQNVFNFILIAFVLFMLIKGANKLKKKQAIEVKAIAGPTQEELLIQIRDLLKK